VPDASTGDQQGQQPPPPPDKQIDQQISLGKVMDRLGSLFGADWQTTAGGGGTGGQFMFASIGELDAVIAQWETQYDAITVDGDAIDQAAGFVEPPAEDGMSVGQADATRQSLVKLKEHNIAMRDYAKEYIKKLKASRASMVNTDQGNSAQLRHVDGS
jgi:hypothetical protein